MAIRSALLAGVFIIASTTVALAGPITGQPPASEQAAPSTATSAPNDNPTATSFTAGSLFDATGATLLQTAGIHYLELGTHAKLSQLGAGFGSYGYYSGNSGSGTTDAGALAPPLGAIGNLTPEVPLGSTDPLLSFTPVAIPEPGVVLLLVPAAAFAARQRLRRRDA